jgi:hypothetical protein
MVLREKLIEHYERAGRAKKFRNREVSRLEGFSDAVFAFAITLLTVSLEVPKTSGELLNAMRGFVAFALTFFVLFAIWYRQFSFFRRYGLEDNISIGLNAILLFVVLFFTYPLKFIAQWMTNRLMGGSKTILLENGQVERIVRPEHMPWLFGIYGLGFAAVFGVFALLYGHALAKSAELGLNDLELFDARQSVRLSSLISFLGLLVALSGAASVYENSPGPLRLLTYVVLIGILGGVFLLMRLRLSGRKHRRAIEQFSS